MRARSWSGLSATTIWMVEQFGLAMMPLCQARSCGFTSGTTSGQAGSIRHAELLSMTTAPCRTAFGARSRLASPPAEKIAMSMPAKFASVASRQAHGPAGEGHGRARDLRHVERPQLVHREPTLLERPDHLGADHAGRADDRHVPRLCAHARLPGTPTMHNVDRSCRLSTVGHRRRSRRPDRWLDAARPASEPVLLARRSGVTSRRRRSHVPTRGHACSSLALR